MSFTVRTLSCRTVQAMLDRYIDGDLSPGSSTDLELHLNRCGNCQKELRVLERVVSLVERIDRSTPPPGLWQKVRVEILETGTPTWQTRFFSAFPFSYNAVRPGRLGLAGALVATAAVASVAGMSAFWSHGASPSYGPPIPAGTEVASYASQAQQVSYYDPLADRATLGAMTVTSNTQPAVMTTSSTGGMQVTDAMARGMSAMGGGSGQ